MEALTDPIVGIDLGTSNSSVAHASGGGPAQVLADDAGAKIHPSVVSFHPSGGVVVGAAAKQRKVIDPQNTIYSVKRLIGRGFRSPEVQTARSRVPYQIKEGANQLPMIATRAGEFAVPEISAIVLDHVRNIAAARLGVPVQRAVVTVPASFGDVQRSATATAGAIAGLTVVRVLNEPTAAALAYGHARDLRDIIAVYDFGGGTFDISILKLEDQVYEVLGTAGDTFLGGDDLDERLVDKMVAKFLSDNRIDLRTNEVSMMRLRAVAEQTKIELSRRSRAVVRIDEIAYGPRGAPLNLQIEITRDELVQQVSDLIDRTFPVCREALSLAGVGVDRIGDVILVGGTTKIPYVRDQVGTFFGKAPRADINPEEAVAVGAALQAASLEKILAKSSRGSSKAIAPPTTVTGEIDSSRSRADDRREETTGSIETLDLADPTDARRQPVAATGEILMAPSELTLTPDPGRGKRATSGYSEVARFPRSPSEPTVTKPDTSYSVTRAGARKAEGRPGSHSGLLDDLTPPPQALPQPQAQALGRISKPVLAAPPTTAPTARTLFGVPEAPAGARPPARGAAARSGSASSTVDIPALHSTETEPGIGAAPTSPTSEVTAVGARPPGRPPPVPAAPPSAATMFAPAPDPAAASTAKGFGAPSDTALDRALEDTRLPTARGYEAPAAAAPAIPPPAATGPAAAGAPGRAPVVLEVTPRGLGIGTVAGFCEELIRRNSRLPAAMKKLFTTSRDRQDVVRIIVCQGESRRLDNNVVIGDLVLQGLPPRPRGETSIEVTFSLDASGILQVHARDAQTGAEQRASLDLVGGIPQQDVAAARDRVQQLRR
jgi:molecular chaperone DnaK